MARVLPARQFISLPGVHAARMSFMRAGFEPWPGGAVDIDFITRRYWWAGAEKLESDFTTFNLNGSTFGPLGLTPSSTIDVTLALAGLGTFIPGTLAAAVSHTAAPATGRYFLQVDDGTNANRIAVVQSTTPTISLQIYWTNAVQSSQAPGAVSALATKHGLAMSYQTNSVLAAINGNNAGPDSGATMPAVNTLRIGKAATAGTECLGTIARVVLFTIAKNQPEVNTLSLDMRDS